MTIISSLVRSWILMKVCRLFALLMKWHNSCWTHSHTHTHAHLPHRNWFNFCFIYYIYLCWYFWFFGWHCSSWATTKSIFWGRVDERIDLHCCCAQLNNWVVEIAHWHWIDWRDTYVCMHRPICVCAWLSTLLTRRWVGSFHAGLHKENDLWHVIRHAVGQVDAEVNREIYYVCLAWQCPKGLKRIMRYITYYVQIHTVSLLRGAYFRVNLPLSDSLC